MLGEIDEGSTTEMCLDLRDIVGTRETLRVMMLLGREHLGKRRHRRYIYCPAWVAKTSRSHLNLGGDNVDDKAAGRRAGPLGQAPRADRKAITCWTAWPLQPALHLTGTGRCGKLIDESN